LTHLPARATTPGTDYDVVVLGGGAAGLYCAFHAGRRGRRVAVLEHNARVGLKIGISGGGRCNFTNTHASPENYLSAHPGFCRSALARHTPSDFLALVEKHGVAFHEKKLGQQFCTGSSREIINLLVKECAEARVDVLCGHRVLEVRKSDKFHLTTPQGEFVCNSLVIATGGLSFPKLGASDFGYRVARQFGLPVTELRPGLVPLTFCREDRATFQHLSGAALPVRAQCGGAEFNEAMLFTHRGASGPAILQISSYWREHEPVRLDLLPLPEDHNLLAAPHGPSLENLLARRWPRRFAEAWCARHAPDKPLSQLKKHEKSELENLLHAWPLHFEGTEGYAKAEVTLGGVDVRALSSKTLEARDVRGLFFIGEVVDVTGWLGGYNFQWAWASAHAAGLVV